MAPSRGFTIIELLVSLFIIAAVILLASAILSTTPVSRNARNQDLALKVAETELAELRATEYDSLPVSGAFTDALLTSIPGSAGSITVTDIGSTTKSIMVTVSWQPTTGGTQSVSLTTIVARTGGLQ